MSSPADDSPDSPAGTLRVAIVGCGPRGVTVLERIVALAAAAPQRVEILVFEPNLPGTGVHGTSQPDYLLLNTIAGQLSMFPDEAALGAAPARPGPSFYEWCLDQGIATSRHGTGTPEPCPISPTDFLPRRYLGAYLNWVYEQVVASRPPNVTITLVQDRVTRIRLGAGGTGYDITTGEGRRAAADKVILAVGHARRRQVRSDLPAERVVASVYPLPDGVKRIPAGAAVGIDGLGLTAIDAIAALTVGRGGRFVTRRQRLAYQPSGREPSIHMFSRTGLPFRARPDTTMHRQKHRPLFFTAERLADMRRERGGGPLDFTSDLLPLLKLEMRAAFYMVKSGLQPVGAEMGPLRDDLGSAFAAGAIDRRMRRLEEEFGHFDPSDVLLLRVPQQITGPEYPAWAAEFIRSDLAECVRGLERSPVKAAAEIWRDLREVIRCAVDDDGLTPDSRAAFFSVYAPMINRLVAGPQKERHQELLALIEAGIVALEPGLRPACRWNASAGKLEVRFAIGTERPLLIDYLIEGRLESGSLAECGSELLSDLVGQELVRPLDPARGLDCIHVRSCGRVMDSSNRPNDTIWALGPIVEGSTYYNHYVPSSGDYSRAFADAHGIARRILDL